MNEQQYEDGDLLFRDRVLYLIVRDSNSKKYAITLTNNADHPGDGAVVNIIRKSCYNDDWRWFNSANKIVHICNIKHAFVELQTLLQKEIFK